MKSITEVFHTCVAEDNSNVRVSSIAVCIAQWLVKRAIATREEMGDFNRLFAVSQFNKHNKLPEDERFQANKLTSMTNLQNIKVEFIRH